MLNQCWNQFNKWIQLFIMKYSVQTHLISVGYSSPVYRYMHVIAEARKAFPVTARTVHNICISAKEQYILNQL